MPAASHSLFPPSATKRLLTCPGSHGLSLAHELAGVRRASEPAAMGSLAHLMAETILMAGTDPQSFLGKSFTMEGFRFDIDQDFIDAVMVYVNHIRTLILLDYQILLERQVNPCHLWADRDPLPIELYGTSDCIAYSPSEDHLVVVDLKFGKGVVVEPAENPQLLYYAAGSLDPDIINVLLGKAGSKRRVAKGWTPKNVDLHVVQPRIPSAMGLVHSWGTSGQYVRDWARDTLYPGVLTAIVDQGQTLVAGEYCQFCPVYLSCAEPHRLVQEMAKNALVAAPPEDVPSDGTDPLGLSKNLPATGMSEARIKEILDAAQIIEPLIEQARDIAKAWLDGGNKIEGWKLTTRRGRRDWRLPTGEFIRHAYRLKTPLAEVLQPCTPADIEKRHPDFYQALTPHIVEGDRILILTPEGRTRKRQQAAPALPIPASDITTNS